MKRLSTPRWGALASLVLLTACGAGASFEPSSQTRAQALRIADGDPAEVARMKEAVRPLVDRDPANVRVETLPNGAMRRTFTSGFRSVAILHKGADGKATVTCVDSVDGVDMAMTSARPAEVY